MANSKFIRLWHDSEEHEQEVAIQAIMEGKKEALAKWMGDHPSLDLGDKTLTQLRTIARRLGIKYYAQLMYGELVAAILKKETGGE